MNEKEELLKSYENISKSITILSKIYSECLTKNYYELINIEQNIYKVLKNMK